MQQNLVVSQLLEAGYLVDEEAAKRISLENIGAEVITSNNLVADTDDLTSFVRGVKNLMSEDSIFFFETTFNNCFF